MGYVAGGRGRFGEVDNDYLNGVTGDKGAYSTVEDLFKLDQALYDETLLKQTTLEAAFTPHGGIPRNFKDVSSDELRMALIKFYEAYY